MKLMIGEGSVELDSEGFLRDLNKWDNHIAEALAKQEGITLTDGHWEIIYLVRDFYSTYQISPSMRALVKYTQQILGVQKGQSIYLLQLFPASPAKYISKIAGLPKPTNCI